MNNLPHGDNKTSILEVKESILSRLCTPPPPQFPMHALISRFPLSHKQWYVHSRQGRSQDFPKRGYTVSNRGYSPDFNVDLHAAFYLWNKKGLQKGSHGRLRTPPNYALGQMHDLISRYPLSSIQWYVTLHQRERPKNFLWNERSWLTPCRLSRANKRSTVTNIANHFSQLCT